MPPIRVQLPTGNYARFPEGTSAETIAQALSKTDFGQPEMAWGDAFSQGIGNIPKSGKRFVGDMWEAVTHPLDTATNIGKVVAGTAQNLVGYEGDYNQYADAVGQYFADRYGSVEGFKRALAEDPVDILADASTLFTGVGGLAKGAALAGKVANVGGRMASGVGRLADISLQAGKIMDPLYGVGKGTLLAGKGAHKLIRTGITPEKLYLSGLNPGTNYTPAERAALAGTGIEGGYLPTESGIDKLKGAQSGLIEKTGELVQGREILEQNGSAPRNIDPDLAARKARASATEKFGHTVDPVSDLESINSTVDNFLQTHGQEGPIGTARAHQIEQSTQSHLANSHGELPAAEKGTRKALAHQMREGVETNVPEVAPVNRQLQKLDNLLEPLTRAAETIRNTNVTNLPSWINTLKGAAAGGLAGGFLDGTTAALLGSLAGTALMQPTNKARLAIALDRTGKLVEKASRAADRLPRLPSTLPARQAARLSHAAEEYIPNLLQMFDQGGQ